MNELPHCVRGMDLSGLTPPEAREELLNRLEGLLHHLMSDLMDALALVNAVKEAAEQNSGNGQGRGGQRQPSHPY